MIVLGLISGTSVDAIDVAVADLSWAGPDILLRPLGHREATWPDATRRRILAALPPALVTMGDVCALDVLIGEAFAAVARQAQLEHGGELVASHGQNLFHWTELRRARGTLQLGQPACIVEATGLPVVSDFRARDVAAGGQGAPLASTLDALWLSGEGGPRAALNLGGIANITVVGRAHEAVFAYDTGPASCLLDMEAARISGGAQSCDLDGGMALTGTVRRDVLTALLREPYYSAKPPKSTGRELFDTGYVAAYLRGLPAITGPDLMATLTELTALTVAQACRSHGVTEIVASGGGTRNPALMAALARHLAPASLVMSEKRGLPSGAKEAYLFALLGFLTWHGLPGVVPGATGSAIPRVLGRISPGNSPLRLPAPAQFPRALIIEA